MQTFVPYSNFFETAKVLDRQRLGKQRVECLQILNTLTGRSTGWSTHPATKMWQGHAASLANYALIMCMEWARRGYKDTCAEQIMSMVSEDERADAEIPAWVFDPEVLISHRSNLLRKMPEHYSRFWDVSPDIPYKWPV